MMEKGKKGLDVFLENSIVVLVLVFSLLFISVYFDNGGMTGHAIAGGTGIESDPYVIDSCGSLDLQGNYVLGGDISASGDCIVVNNDSIVLDGKGYNITGSGSSGNGIILSGRTNVTLKNLSVYKFTNGITLSSSNNNNLVDIISSNNFCGSYGCFSSGINIISSNNNIFLNIRASDNLCTNWRGGRCSSTGISLYSSNNNSFLDINASKNRCEADYCRAMGLNLSSSNNNSFSRIEISDLSCYCGTSCFSLGASLSLSSYNNFSSIDFSLKPENQKVMGWGALNWNIAGNSLNDYLDGVLISKGIISGFNLNHCGNILEPGTYTLSTDIEFFSTSYNCFDILTDNVTLEGNNHLISSSGHHFTYGFGISNRNNITIKDLFVSNTGGIFLSSSNNNVLSNISLINSNPWGIDGSSEGIFISSSNNNTISKINSSDSSMELYSSNNNVISDLFLSGSIFDVINSAYNTISNISLANWLWVEDYGEIVGLYLRSSSNNIFSNILVSNISCVGFGCGVSGIYIYKSDNNTLSNVQIFNVSCSGTDCYSNGMRFTASGIYSSTLSNFSNSGICSSTLVNATLDWNNLNFGRITFLEPLNTGLTLDCYRYTDILLTNSSVSLDSTNQPGLNVPANITFYLIGWKVSDASILRDEEICNETTIPACYNFTSLNGGIVKFNVSSWSTYTLNGTFEQTCGNNLVELEYAEQCDGSDFGGLSCSNYGFSQGGLACSSDCSQIITAGCSNPNSGGSPGGSGGSGGSGGGGGGSPKKLNASLSLNNGSANTNPNGDPDKGINGTGIIPISLTDEQKSNLSKALIIGLSIGVIFIGALILVVLFYGSKRKENNLEEIRPKKIVEEQKEVEKKPSMLEKFRAWNARRKKENEKRREEREMERKRKEAQKERARIIELKEQQKLEEARKRQQEIEEKRRLEEQKIDEAKRKQQETEEKKRQQELAKQQAKLAAAQAKMVSMPKTQDDVLKSKIEVLLMQGKTYIDLKMNNKAREVYEDIHRIYNQLEKADDDLFAEIMDYYKKLK